MERATGTEVYGCGSPQSTDITLNIQTTTGGNFSISLDGKHTVEYLKKVVSKKLKVSKDRICLLHRERQLRDGTLEENGLLDGSRIILLPSVETGLLSQRPENSVMQALESLNDTQVNDFLSGKSPLNLTMRLGDNMMLIQLQLSTLNSSGSRTVRTPTKVSKSSMTCDAALDTPSPQTTSEKSSIFSDEDIPLDTDMQTKVEKPSCVIDKQDWELLQNAFDLYRSMTVDKYTDIIKSNDVSMDTSNCTASDTSSTSLESTQSPIKSLSNLVSSPINTSTSEEKEKPVVKKVSSSLLDLLTKGTSLEPVPSTSGTTKKISSSSATCQPTSANSQPASAICQPTSANSDSSLSDDSDNFTDQSSFLAENTIDEYPMENLFNSAVDKGLFEDQDESLMDREISNLATTSNGAQDSANGNLPSFQSITEPLKNKRFQLLLHKTSKFKHPIGQNKQKAFMQSVVNKHKKRMQNKQDSNLAHPSTSRTEPYITNSRKLILQPSNEQESDDMAIPSTSKQTMAATDTAKQTQALIEASKNLTQKLKKLSKEVLTNKLQLRAVEELRSKIGSGAGAVIESMKHHGKGIYSGTFSGTLNPALQDRYGRPKRDISTIIHILNDLLCAAPPIALAQKDSKHSCSPSTTDEPNKCLGCSQPSCSYGQCDGHLPSTSTTDSKDCICDQQNCKCGRLTPNTCPTCSGKSNTGELCKKCESAKTLAMENSKTKCKLEQLRLVMQQKKQRREERKLKTLPYISPQKALTNSPEPTQIQEEIDTVA